jgi:hypothetical protein
VKSPNNCRHELEWRQKVTAKAMSITVVCTLCSLVLTDDRDIDEERDLERAVSAWLKSLGKG